MTNDFRVIRENTFNLKGGKLYVMVLRDNGKYGVEVVDREKTFGRKMTDTNKEADLLFDSIVSRLNKYTVIKDAELAIKRCFKFKSINKILFVLVMDNKISSQADIVSIGDKVKFVTKVKFNRIKGLITINVFESRDEKKPFATLTGKDNGKSLIFHLI